MTGAELRSRLIEIDAWLDVLLAQDIAELLAEDTELARVAS